MCNISPLTRTKPVSSWYKLCELHLEPAARTVVYLTQNSLLLECGYKSKVLFLRIKHVTLPHSRSLKRRLLILLKLSTTYVMFFMSYIYSVSRLTQCSTTSGPFDQLLTEIYWWVDISSAELVSVALAWGGVRAVVDYSLMAIIMTY